MNKKLLLIVPLIALLGACNSNNKSEENKTTDESSEVETNVTETGETEITEESTEEVEEAKLATLGFDDFPAPVNGNNYPADSTITSESGVSFNIGGAMQNTGKFSTNTVQFRSIKKGDAGYVQNTTPLKGQLTIIIMKNYVEYNQTDMSGELTVSVHDKDGKNEKVLEVVSLGEVDGKYHFTYETTSEHYYSIKNLSDYAVYATDILWEE